MSRRLAVARLPPATGWLFHGIQIQCHLPFIEAIWKKGNGFFFDATSRHSPSTIPRFIITYRPFSNHEMGVTGCDC